MVAFGACGGNTAVIFEVRDVKELEMGVKPVFASEAKIGGDIVEGPEKPGEGDVTLVVKVGFTENEDSVLEGGELVGMLWERGMVYGTRAKV